MFERLPLAVHGLDLAAQVCVAGDTSAEICFGSSDQMTVSLVPITSVKSFVGESGLNGS